jgi:hypothetical protein
LSATIVGTAGADVLSGTSGPDVIVGLGGADTIKGFGGADRICGGAGNDVIEAGPGADRVLGDQGNDTIRGGAGGDVLEGGDGNDRVFGDAGNDTLVGGGGDDVLTGGTGADKLRGSVGADTLRADENDVALDGGVGRDLGDFSLAGTAISVDLAVGGGAPRDGRSGGFSVVWIEDLIGSRFDDQLVGDGKANQIRGGRGVDTIRGGRGADTIRGGDGNDLLFGDEDSDTVDGNEGNDRANGGPGSDVCSAEITYDCETPGAYPLYEPLLYGFDGQLPNAGITELGGVSSDGRWLAFESKATNLVPGVDCESLPPGVDNCYRIYLLDRAAFTVEMIAEGRGRCGVDTYIDPRNCMAAPTVSNDGRFVAFDSEWTGLVEGDTNITRDVFVKDRTTGELQRVSLNVHGSESSSTIRGQRPTSLQPRFNWDSSEVWFLSLADNLVPGDTNSGFCDQDEWNRVYKDVDDLPHGGGVEVGQDLFAKNLATGVVRRIDVDSHGHELPGCTVVFAYNLSGDGTTVALDALASFFTLPWWGNGMLDTLLIKDVTAGTLKEMRARSLSDGHIWPISGSDLSPSGRTLYSTEVWPYSWDDAALGWRCNSEDVYSFDIATGRPTLVSDALYGRPGTGGCDCCGKPLCQTWLYSYARGRSPVSADGTYLLMRGETDNGAFYSLNLTTGGFQSILANTWADDPTEPIPGAPGITRREVLRAFALFYLGAGHSQLLLSSHYGWPTPGAVYPGLPDSPNVVIRLAP